MTAVHRLNGLDCATLHWYLDAEVGAHTQVARSRQAVAIHRRAGTLTMAPGSVGSRKITLRGSLVPTTATAAGLRVAADDLKDRLDSGLVRLELEDGAAQARQIEAYCEDVEITPTGHPFFGAVARVEARLTCPDPFWRDVEPTTTALATPSARYSVALGTAPSAPVLRVMGSATTPTVTYRDAGGTAIWSLTLATLAADEYVDVDMRSAKATFYDSGVNSNGLAYISAGDFPWALDPQDGDYRTASWPTVEVSAGQAELLFWRAWK